MKYCNYYLLKSHESWLSDWAGLSSDNRQLRNHSDNDRECASFARPLAQTVSFIVGWRQRSSTSPRFEPKIRLPLILNLTSIFYSKETVIFTKRSNTSFLEIECRLPKERKFSSRSASSATRTPRAASTARDPIFGDSGAASPARLQTTPTLMPTKVSFSSLYYFLIF